MNDFGLMIEFKIYTSFLQYINLWGVVGPSLRCRQAQTWTPVQCLSPPRFSQLHICNKINANQNLLMLIASSTTTPTQITYVTRTNEVCYTWQMKEDLWRWKSYYYFSILFDLEVVPWSLINPWRRCQLRIPRWMEKSVLEFRSPTALNMNFFQ